MKNWLGKELKIIRSGWYLWLFPLFAVGITVWLFMAFYREHGPTIHILFEDAAGIQPQKTQVRFRGVKVGIVNDVQIAEDNKGIIAEVSLLKSAEQFAVPGSRFSLVLPKVNFEGVSGLETLFEGTYIALTPGPPSEELQTEFKALPNSASTENLDETITYFLETTNAESINSGDLLSFRGLKVGSVTKLALTPDSQLVRIQINVERKYRRLIRSNTVFWRKPGVHARLGLFNSELTINSLETILHGGIEFSTPEPAGPIAKSHTRFFLESGPPKDSDKWNPKLAYQSTK